RAGLQPGCISSQVLVRPPAPAPAALPVAGVPPVLRDGFVRTVDLRHDAPPFPDDGPPSPGRSANFFAGSAKSHGEVRGDADRRSPRLSAAVGEADVPCPRTQAAEA